MKITKRKLFIKLFLTGLFLLLFFGCDPVSISEIYVINSTSQEISLEIDTLTNFHYDKTTTEVITVNLLPNEIKPAYNAYELGTKAVNPAEVIKEIRIHNSNGELLKKITGDRALFTLFRENTMVFGSEENSYMVIINNDLLEQDNN